ncbi:insulin-like peptide 03 isoform X2 [Oculina patagonica]
MLNKHVELIMSIYTESTQKDSNVLLLYFQMKNACFWSTVALVAIVLCFETVKGGRKYKLYEVGRRPIDGIYCGDRIMDAYFALCYSGKRKRSSTLMDEKEASKFLHSQTIRNKRSTGTDIVEECCTEGCAYEEIYEYC